MTSRFDTYIKIRDGTSKLNIKGKDYPLKLANEIIIPAHSPHHFNSNVEFKMISTVIKSGYEDL